MLQLLKCENTKYLADGLTNCEELRKNYYLRWHCKRKKNSKRQPILMVIVHFGIINLPHQYKKLNLFPLQRKTLLTQQTQYLNLKTLDIGQLQHLYASSCLLLSRKQVCFDTTMSI